MKIGDRANAKVPPVKPGSYIGICVGVIDLGEQYSEFFKHYSNQVQIVWELPNQLIDIGGEQKPRQLSRTFTFSVGKKSTLRAFLTSWNGIQYTDEQIKNLELFDQLGKTCLLNVVLNSTGEYANVDSIMPVPDDIPVPKTETPFTRWDTEQWDDNVFETLPEWVQGKIKKSTQYQKEHPPAQTVDFPAAKPVSVEVTEEDVPF